MGAVVEAGKVLGILLVEGPRQRHVMSSQLRLGPNFDQEELAVLSNPRQQLLRAVKDRVRYPVLLIKSPLAQFTPFSAGKTAADSCVIGNGVPKSGTYLVHSIVAYLKKWEDIGIHIDPMDWRTVPTHGEPTVHRCLSQFAVNKLRNGQLVAAHMPWSKSLEKRIGTATASRRVKHVLMYRDPRDIFVSWMRWTTYPEGPVEGTIGKKRQRFMTESFSNDDERLAYVIQNRKECFGPGFLPWLQNPHCMAIKFENLYPEVLGLKDGVIGDVLRRLFNYLEVETSRIDPVDCFDRVHGQSRTASSEPDKVGQHRRVFKDFHYTMLDTPDFRSILNDYGYAW